MKYLKVYVILLIGGLFSACGDHKHVDPKPPLEGGKGGDYAIAVFTKHHGVGKSSRIFLKYATDKNPLDTNLYEERSNTMTEPGFGPHAHFNSLTKGSYYIYCLAANNVKGDTVLVISSATSKSSDIYLNLE